MRTVTDTVAGTKPPDVTRIRAFAGIPESVAAARAWVAGFVPGCPAADDIALMTSELVTNAILHSASCLPGGQVTVSVRAGDDMVRVDVVDQGDLPPRSRQCPGIGQGLALVAALADVFGADGTDRWFALRTGGAR
jgi:anti-sigma regulatory factor (Ser/Thr protein kinase)